MSTMNQTIKRIWNTATSGILVIILVLAAAIWGVQLLGIDVFVVLSGSMEPEYPTGSLIYVKEVDTQILETGDVITFYLTDSTVVTHRIEEVVEQSGKIRFITKGDANEVTDGGLIGPESIIGTPVLTVPYLGFFVAYIQQPPGSYVALAIAALIVILVILPDLIFDDKKQENA